MEENNHNYMYILDFSYPGIYEIELTEEDQDLTSEQILEKRGLKKDICDFMYSENKLELLTLN